MLFARTNADDKTYCGGFGKSSSQARLCGMIGLLRCLLHDRNYPYGPVGVSVQPSDCMVWTM